jgi:hypothetical protein
MIIFLPTGSLLLYFNDTESETSQKSLMDNSALISRRAFSREFIYSLKLVRETLCLA